MNQSEMQEQQELTALENLFKLNRLGRRFEVKGGEVGGVYTVEIKNLTKAELRGLAETMNGAEAAK